MKKRKGNLVTHQKVSHDNTHSNNPYWDAVAREGTGETAMANPDILEDVSTNSIWGRGSKPELAEIIIERFMGEDGNFPILSKQENLVLKLYTTTGDMQIVCKETKLSRASVRKYLARIRSKFVRLLPAVGFRS